MYSTICPRSLVYFLGIHIPIKLYVQVGCLGYPKLKKNGTLKPPDEKPFSCAECSAAFKFKNSLRRHERTHTKEKNHKCDQCDMTFVQKCDLTRHRDTHEDSGFVCKVCKDVFARKDSLLRHQRLHRPTGKIECPIDGCSEVVASRSALLNHFRTGHSRLCVWKRERKKEREREKERIIHTEASTDGLTLRRTLLALKIRLHA